MDVKSKLTVHLEHIVMPEGVPLTGAQVTVLCELADAAQRQAAVDRAHQRNPFLLPDEETEARMWVEGA